jgi:hypothetical protein
MHEFVRNHVALYLNLKSKLSQAPFRCRHLVGGTDLVPVRHAEQIFVNQ